MEIFEFWNIFPEIYYNQGKRTTDTIAKQLVIMRLLPMRVVIHRKIRAENTLPIGAIEAIHETSSSDNGPVVSGVSSDFSKGKTGVSQPTMQPWDNDIKLTTNARNWNYYFSPSINLVITSKDGIILVTKMTNWWLLGFWFQIHIIADLALTLTSAFIHAKTQKTIENNCDNCENCENSECVTSLASTDYVSMLIINIVNNGSIVRTIMKYR